MATMRWVRWGLVGAVAMTGGLAFATPALAPQLAALSTIEAGQWELRDADGGATRAVCVADGRAFLQIRHTGNQCSRFVVADAPRAVTVHYTCPGAGHGRTTVSLQTPRSARIETQGVADGAPFQLAYSARRIGACQTTAR